MPEQCRAFVCVGHRVVGSLPANATLYRDLPLARPGPAPYGAQNAVRDLPRPLQAVRICQVRPVSGGQTWAIGETRRAMAKETPVLTCIGMMPRIARWVRD